jgi:ABC-type transporter Mla subunit MlaD
MDLSGTNSILPSLGLITGLATTWYSVQKVVREYRKNRKKEADRILDEAKELDRAVKDRLEAKIDLLEAELHSLQDSVAKDLNHIKETQASELRNLSDKIELLREEIRDQSSGILSLLTQLVKYAPITFSIDIRSSEFKLRVTGSESSMKKMVVS